MADGNTPLHDAVQDNDFSDVMSLLGKGADVNDSNNEGNTPLHEATTPAVLQALLVFGANVQAVNIKNRNPCHIIASSSYKYKDEMLYILHSIGSPRCKTCLEDCVEGCSPSGTFNGIPPDDQVLCSRSRINFDAFLDKVMMADATSKPGGSGRILCLDGGGIKGLLLTQLLIAIQEAAGGRPITELFDWIAGTSTGGMLALALALGKSPRYTQRLYFRMKNLVFTGWGLWGYSVDPLEKLLKKEFGEKTVMADIKDVKVIVTGAFTDRTPTDLHLFRNYESPENQYPNSKNTVAFSPIHLPESSNEQLVWEAARATGAAPTYFKCFKSYCDGGVIANNPTLDVLTEITECNTTLKNLKKDSHIFEPKVVVSLGTGCFPVKEVDNHNGYEPEHFWQITGLSSSGFGMKDTMRLLIGQATNTDNRVVDRARAWCAMSKIPYIRMNPQLSQELEMEETDDEKLVKALWESMVYIKEKKEQIQQFADLLTDGL